MSIVPLVSGPDEFEPPRAGQEIWPAFDEIAEPASAWRRISAEHIEALALQAEIEIELACEGVLDSEMQTLLAGESVGWKVRPSQGEREPGLGQQTPRSSFFRCASSGVAA